MVLRHQLLRQARLCRLRLLLCRVKLRLLPLAWRMRRWRLQLFQLSPRNQKLQPLLWLLRRLLLVMCRFVVVCRVRLVVSCGLLRGLLLLRQ